MWTSRSLSHFVYIVLERDFDGVIHLFFAYLITRPPSTCAISGIVVETYQPTDLCKTGPWVRDCLTYLPNLPPYAVDSYKTAIRTHPAADTYIIVQPTILNHAHTAVATISRGMHTLTQIAAQGIDQTQAIC
jgi:hypothetical protein